MNDIRRTILWVIFGFSMVLLWDQWQIFNGQKPTFFPPATPAATAPAPVAAAGSNAAVPGAIPASAANSAVPPAAGAVGAAAVPGANGATAAEAPALRREQIVVSNDVLTLTFDTEGGTLVRSVFNKYVDMNDKSQGFVLLDQSSSRIYTAQSGLIGAASFPTHKTLMTALPGERTLKDGQDKLEIKFESPEVGGVKLIKTYTLKRGAYDVGVRHEVVNNSADDRLVLIADIRTC